MLIAYGFITEANIWGSVLFVYIDITVKFNSNINFVWLCIDLPWLDKVGDSK